MTKLRQTPSQTVGPYFAYGLSPEQYGYQQNLTSIAGSQMAEGDVEGERIRVEGRVFDGAGNPISDALIEIWQADSLGRYAHPADPRGSNNTFKGFGRCGTGTDPQHRYWFDTIKPGKVNADAGATSERHRVHARDVAACVHPHLFSGRTRRMPRTRCCGWFRRNGETR
jgi:protocatechuate 3,4-dioxygenase alpha subunit